MRITTNDCKTQIFKINKVERTNMICSILAITNTRTLPRISCTVPQILVSYMVLRVFELA